MVDFRRLFLVLAVIALVAIPASAQPLSCTAQAAGTPSIRSEGITELVGDILIFCTGGTPIASGTQVPSVNIQIFSSPSINITSKLLVSPWSEALLLIDEPSAAAGNQTLCGSTTAPESSVVGVCNVTGTGTGVGTYAGTAGRPNVFQGRQVGANSLIWQGVPIDPPGTGQRIIRITNVRVNASQLGVPAGAQASVALVISTSASGLGPTAIALPITNPAPTVAVAQNSYSTAMRDARTDLQCVARNCDFITDSTTAAPGRRSDLRVTELFPTALRRRNVATTAATPTALAAQNELAQIYHTETGFYNGTTSAQWIITNSAVRGNILTAGLADSGTRLLLRFAGVPAGVNVYLATVLNIVSTTTPNPTTGTLHLVTADSNGAGAYAAATAWGSQGFGAGLYSLVSIVGGVGTATYEVVASNTSDFERVDIPIAYAWCANPGAGLPALGTATINGTLAPVSTVTTASATAPIPRFADTGVTRTFLTMHSCQTNLLWPFVTNQAGFDTGMVISNTSRDPYATSLQAGACTIHYYGGTPGGGAAPAAQTSSSIPAGEQAVWTLSGGGNFGIAATPGFQGYVIARCNFQFAHGYAFISDLGATRLAQGYLALVLDSQWAGFPRTGVSSEVLGH